MIQSHSRSKLAAARPLTTQSHRRQVGIHPHLTHRLNTRHTSPLLPFEPPHLSINYPRQLPPVRSTDASWFLAVRRSGHIDRTQFVRPNSPDSCHLSDSASGSDLSDAEDQIDTASVCRTDARKEAAVRNIGRDDRRTLMLIVSQCRSMRQECEGIGGKVRISE